MERKASSLASARVPPKSYKPSSGAKSEVPGLQEGSQAQRVLELDLGTGGQPPGTSEFQIMEDGRVVGKDGKPVTRADGSFVTEADVQVAVSKRITRAFPDVKTINYTSPVLAEDVKSAAQAKQTTAEVHRSESPEYPFCHGTSKAEFEEKLKKHGREEVTMRFLEAAFPLETIIDMIEAVEKPRPRSSSVVKYKPRADEDLSGPEISYDPSQLQVIKGDVSDLLRQDLSSISIPADRLAALEMTMNDIKKKRREYETVIAHLTKVSPDRRAVLSLDFQDFRKWIEDELKNMDTLRRELGAEEEFDIYSSVSEAPSRGSSSSSVEETEIELSEARANRAMDDKRAELEREELELKIKRRQLEKDSEIVKLEYKLETAKSSVLGRESKVASNIEPMYAKVNKPKSILKSQSGAISKVISERTPPENLITDPSLRQWKKLDLLKKPADPYKGERILFHTWWTNLKEQMDELGLSPSERINVLKVHTEGPPKTDIQLISTCSVGDTAKAYEEIVEMLNERYGSGPELAAEVRRRIDKFSPIKGDNIGNQLRKLADESRRVNFLMPKVPELSDFSTGYGQEQFRSKLPKYVQDKWAVEGIKYEEKYNSHPPFSYFSEFLVKQARNKTHPRYAHISHEPQNDQSKAKKDKEYKKTSKVLKTEKKDEVVEKEKTQENKNACAGRSSNNSQQSQCGQSSNVDLSSLPCSVHRGHHTLDKCTTYPKMKDFGNAQDEILAKSIALKDSMAEKGDKNNA